MIINPIIPIWVMAIICIICAILFKRSKKSAFIRQIIILALLFVMNLRIMVHDSNAEKRNQSMDAHVLFVVDDTYSMFARDYDGNKPRMDGVIKDTETIINSLYGASYSIISFTNNANMLCPSTSDANYTKNLISSLKPMDEFYAHGTSINIVKDMFVSTVQRLYEKNDGKVIVFFISDGEITDNSQLESFNAAEKYIDGGAVLGYGTSKGGKMYITSYWDGSIEELMDKSKFPYEHALSKIDENNLQKIASDLGIDYSNMNNEKNLESIINDVKKDINISSSHDKTEGYTDIYFYFVIPIVGLLIYELIEYKRKG